MHWHCAPCYRLAAKLWSLWITLANARHPNGTSPLASGYALSPCLPLRAQQSSRGALECLEPVSSPVCYQGGGACARCRVLQAEPPAANFPSRRGPSISRRVDRFQRVHHVFYTKESDILFPSIPRQGRTRLRLHRLPLALAQARLVALFVALLVAARAAVHLLHAELILVLLVRDA